MPVPPLPPVSEAQSYQICIRCPSVPTELQGRTMTDFVVSAVQDATLQHCSEQAEWSGSMIRSLYTGAAVAAATVTSPGACLCPSQQNLAH